MLGCWRRCFETVKGPCTLFDLKLYPPPMFSARLSALSLFLYSHTPLAERRVLTYFCTHSTIQGLFPLTHATKAGHLSNFSFKAPAEE